MRRILAKLAWRRAKRHPRTALKLTASAVSHPRRTAKLIRFARRASTVAQDTATRKKARAATASASRAAARARQIGPTAAAGDKRFLAELRRAAQATVATYHAATRKPKRRLRRVALGASLIGAGLYAKKRRHRIRHDDT